MDALPPLAVFERGPDAVWVVGDGGRILYANEKARDLLHEGARGKRARDWPPAWPEATRAAFERALCAARRDDSARFRVFVPASGERGRFWQTTVTAVPEPAVPEPTGSARFVVHTQDVTGEVETLAFLESIVQTMPSALFVKSLDDGRYVLVNRAAEDYLDAPADELLGRTDAERFGAEEGRRREQVDKAAAGAGAVVTADEVVVSTAWDAPREFQVRRVAMHDDHGPRHLIALGEDVTDQRATAAALKSALSAAERANDAKDAFLSNMSHELRTPLNAIVGAGDLLARKALDLEDADLVRLIGDGARTLQRLVSDLLDLTRMQANGITAAAAPFDLGSLVESAAWIARTEADQRGIAFRLEAPPPGLRLIGDAPRLSQALNCLLGNAVKFTDRGEVVLTVSQLPDGVWRFSVRDTGIGFDPARKAQLFETFEQIDGAFTRRFGGSGIGLAVAKRLACAMGGRIDCDSTPGQGSEFWIDVPLPTDAAAEPPAPAAPEAGEAPQGLRVLLADDHAVNRQIVETMLAGAAEVESVEDGQAAVRSFRDHRPDVVLMDMQMPVMDGLAAVREIRKLETEHQSGRTPIIMISANVLPEHVDAALTAGADMHLAKPVTVTSLFAALGAHL